MKRINQASNTEEGIKRSLLYQIMVELVPEGDLLDRIQEIMDNLKKNEKKKWDEPIYQNGMRPPKEPKEKQAPKKDQKKDVKYPYKNWHDYQSRNGCTTSPGFPRPANCPANKKYWCQRCGYSNHDSTKCFHLHPELKTQPEKQGQSSRRRSRSRSPHRRRSDDNYKRSDRK